MDTYPGVPLGVPVAHATVVDAAHDASTNPTPQLQSTPHPPLDAAQKKELHARGFPPGLQACVHASLAHHPLRIWIVDNSGSMQSTDGNRLVLSGTKGRFIQCTRWDELKGTLNEIASLTTIVGARTDMLLLNPSPSGRHVSLVDDGGRSGIPVAPTVGVENFERMVSHGPGGTTPLTESVRYIIRMVQPAATALREAGNKVAVVIATDGRPDNVRSFLDSLKELQRLPVWVVVRLCTDEEDVVEFWNDLDAKLESPLEVLDDQLGEANEVGEKNRWLAYGTALHRAREFGSHEKLFDLLDEQALAPSQCKQLIELILGCDTLPEPELDPAAFLAAVETAQREAPQVFNPTRSRFGAWVEPAYLKRHISPGRGCVIS